MLSPLVDEALCLTNASGDRKVQPLPCQATWKGSSWVPGCDLDFCDSGPTLVAQPGFSSGLIAYIHVADGKHGGNSRAWSSYSVKPSRAKWLCGSPISNSNKGPFCNIDRAEGSEAIMGNSWLWLSKCPDAG